MAVSVLLKIKFRHTQVRVPKIGIPMSKTACINPCLHHMSKYNLILRTNQFIDVRCKKWGNLTIFLKSFALIFINQLGAKVHEYFSVMVSGNECKYCNLIESKKTVFRRFQDYFPIFAKRASCINYFRPALKRLAFNSSAITC